MQGGFCPLSTNCSRIIRESGPRTLSCLGCLTRETETSHIYGVKWRLNVLSQSGNLWTVRSHVDLLLYVLFDFKLWKNVINLPKGGPVFVFNVMSWKDVGIRKKMSTLVRNKHKKKTYNPKLSEGEKFLTQV